MALSRIKRSIMVNLVMWSPFVFILTVVFVSVTWLNPIRSYRYHTGAIISAYAGCPYRNTCSFKAVLENGKRTDVSQNFNDERLRIGDKVCARITVRKSVDWRHGQLVDMSKCSK